MSRAFRLVCARRALDSHSLIYTPHRSTCPLFFSLERVAYFSSFGATIAHTHTEADGGRRITTPSSGHVSESLAQHLNKTFPPLEFPPALAQRLLTHLSHRDSLTGHNSRFSFLGGVASLVPRLSVPSNFCHRRAKDARGLHDAFPTRTPSRGRTRPLTHRGPCFEHAWPRRTRCSSLETTGRYALGPATRRRSGT
jgi:hypothetical protein